MSPTASLASACFLALAALARAQGPAPRGTNGTGPLSQFYSRPDIYAPFLNITLLEEDLVTPGYIFLGPYQTYQAGPYIYDNRGNLVWSGYAQTGGGPSHAFHVCQPEGSDGGDHLCYITGGQNVGYVRGYAVVLDNTFSAVNSIYTHGGLSNIDEHEFNVLSDGSALFSLYHPERYDLSSLNITEGQGWIQNAWFQHIDLDTKELLFEWSAIEHVPLSHAVVLPNSTEVSGTGLDPTSPYDYFHINSVDMNADGDYLISARHTCAIYKISGQDGHIIWTLGGVDSTFSFPPGLNFSYQHDARFRHENATTTIISLLDNASNGYHQTSRYSSGMVLRLDHTDNTVSLVRQYVAPHDMISASQANVQLLGPNSAWNSANYFAGWGSNAFISEYTNDGRLVQEGHFATTGTMNYRAYKANFTSNPVDAPAMYAYALSDTTATRFWVSWNGATRVRQWRVLGSQDRDGPWTTVATVPKDGFETSVTAREYFAWGMVQALGADGTLLRNSTRPVRTFVPGAGLAAACDETQCAIAEGYATPSSAEVPSPTESGDGEATSDAAPVQRRNVLGNEWNFAAVFGLGAGFGAVML